MDLPTPYTLTVRGYNGTTSDSHGNTVESWGNATDWKVYGYASGANDEPNAPAREDLSTVLWTVYAPISGLPNGRAKVTLLGVEYEVDGDPRDYSHDPWQNHVGDGVVYLKAVTG